MSCRRLISFGVCVCVSRWVARIGVTRSTQACFLAADQVSWSEPRRVLKEAETYLSVALEPERAERRLARTGFKSRQCAPDSDSDDETDGDVTSSSRSSIPNDPLSSR